MKNKYALGRIFYGSSIAVIGFLTIYYHDFPYMLIPPKHSWIPGLPMLAYIFGGSFVLAGTFIVFKIKTMPVALALGTLLLLIFCFYFIPYEFMVSKNYMHFGDWENAAKELALAAGAFVIASQVGGENKNPLIRSLSKLIPCGIILFSITIISFATDHFLFAKEAADYVPSWIPWHLFWLYFTGTALLGSGLAIILNIKRGIAATLLALMILSWFIMLHLPRIIASPVAYLGSEVTSAFIALAYSGIAFAIAGATKKQRSTLTV
jgi:hypothetical protein